MVITGCNLIRRKQKAIAFELPDYPGIECWIPYSCLLGYSYDLPCDSYVIDVVDRFWLHDKKPQMDALMHRNGRSVHDGTRMVGIAQLRGSLIELINEMNRCGRDLPIVERWASKLKEIVG